jgi:excisionase family DNA binding protein
MASGELLTARQAAELVGTSKSGWYRMVASGRAPARVRMPGVWRWRKADVVRWLERLPVVKHC